jgi:glyoxylase-like metal-dependent hydrolase (beta-lactamase superfamily II)
MLAKERDAATARKTTLDRMRYRPQQWSTKDNWRTYDVAKGGDKWFGFERVRALDGITSDIAMVPLIGHSLGHAGVAVRRANDWLLLAGDAYFYWAEMDVNRPRCTPGLRFYQVMMEKDRSMRLRNQRRLRALKRRHGGEVTIISSHDKYEFEACAHHPLDVPASRVVAAPEIAIAT